jgi:hypothetical protein
MSQQTFLETQLNPERAEKRERLAGADASLYKQIDNNILDEYRLAASTPDTKSPPNESRPASVKLAAGDIDANHEPVQSKHSQAQASRTKPPEPVANVEKITAPDDFATAGKHVLAKINTGITGEATKEQLAGALEDPSITGKEAQALAAMYMNFDSLHNLNGWEGRLKWRSITGSDLDRYAGVQNTETKRLEDARAIRDWACDHLKQFDANRDGSLTRAEIAAALKHPETSPYDKEILQKIDDHYSEMGHVWESAVNMRAIENFARYGDNWNPFTYSSNLALKEALSNAFQDVNMGQNFKGSRDLYADSQNPLNSITPEAIKQGSINDCYFLSSLAAEAQAHPEIVRDSIKDNSNGTYTVTFRGDKDKPVTIKAPTEAEQGVYNHGAGYGLWASVMEKAFGEYRRHPFWLRSLFNLSGGDTPTEGSNGGDQPSRVMKLLTGGDVSTSMLMFTSQSTLAANLERAFASQPTSAVTAGILGGLLPRTADGFGRQHAYTITGFSPDGKGGGMVTIRNPYVQGDNLPGGRITVSLGKFIRNFSLVSIEQ